MYKNGYIGVVKKDIGGRNLSLEVAELLIIKWHNECNSSSSYRGRVAVLTRLWYEAHGKTKETFADIEWLKETNATIHHGIKKPQRFLNSDDITAMYGACNSDRQSLFVAFLTYTGLRVSEMAGIKLSQTKSNHDGLTITIPAEKTGITITRTIPYDMAHKIAQTFNGRTWLFETQGRKPYCRQYISRQISAIGQRALGWRPSAHKLRHYWAEMRQNDGCYPLDTAAMMGHKNPGSHIANYLHGLD